MANSEVVDGDTILSRRILPHPLELVVQTPASKELAEKMAARQQEQEDMEDDGVYDDEDDVGSKRSSHHRRHQQHQQQQQMSAVSQPPPLQPIGDKFLTLNVPLPMPVFKTPAKCAAKKGTRMMTWEWNMTLEKMAASPAVLISKPCPAALQCMLPGMDNPRNKMSGIVSPAHHIIPTCVELSMTNNEAPIKFLAKIGWLSRNEHIDAATGAMGAFEVTKGLMCYSDGGHVLQNISDTVLGELLCKKHLFGLSYEALIGDARRVDNNTVHVPLATPLYAVLDAIKEIGNECRAVAGLVLPVATFDGYITTVVKPKWERVHACVAPIDDLSIELVPLAEGKTPAEKVEAVLGSLSAERPEVREYHTKRPFTITVRLGMDYRIMV
jgi:hypothetical protein